MSALVAVAEERKALTRRHLRTIEYEIGVFLDLPVIEQQTDNQQFGVYDDEEVYVGDVCAEGKFFSYRELTSKIRKLFALKGVAIHRE